MVQKENPVVPCRTIGEMRRYLEEKKGKKFRVDCKHDTVYIYDNGIKQFFGYIDDVAMNIQGGYYE